jgi:hypothetical protein
VGAGHVKKECQIHRSCDAMTSRMTVHPSACPFPLPCKRPVLSLLMHTINTSYHLRNNSCAEQCLQQWAL